MSDYVRPHGLEPSRLLCPWNSPGKDTGVGCHALLQGIFLAQGLNLGLLLCRQSLYHFESPRKQNHTETYQRADFNAQEINVYPVSFYNIPDLLIVYSKYFYSVLSCLKFEQST